MFQVCEPLYALNHDSTKKYNVNQGGTSSAKTYTISQVLAMIGAEEPGAEITIVGQDIPNLKKGAIRDMQKVMESSTYLQSFLYDYKNTKGYNKTDRIYEYKNNTLIEFNSYDNEQDARSGKRDYLFVNEANGISWDIFWQLAIRTRKRVFIDYNPSSKFWAHEKLIGNKNCNLFLSDHRHNPFISQELHDEIEAIDDYELWKVYARGLTGQIHGLIYPKFKVIDVMPYMYNTVYGLDFGFNHKMALTEVSRDGNRLFFNELIYQDQLTIGDLIQLMKELNLGKKKIYADHAAADKIEDLKRAGFNVYKADKDVKNGIDFVKRHQLYVTRNSKGLINEFGIYKWKEKDDVVLDEPVKFKDDGMDSCRYGAYTGFRKAKGLIVSGNVSDDDFLDEL
jgi:phage terminase large subunit